MRSPLARIRKHVPGKRLTSVEKVSQNRRMDAKRPVRRTRGAWRYLVDLFIGLATDERLAGTAGNKIRGRQGLVVMDTSLALA